MKAKISRKTILITTFSLLFTLIGGGTIIFHSMEDWTWIQSFYFTIVTMTTVGYGDLTPSSDKTRLVTAIFILVGVAIGAGIISFYGSNVVRNRIEKRAENKSTR